MASERQVEPLVSSETRKPAALEREVLSILNQAQIYDVESYGWLNENDPDPDFIGHAMWQLNQPFIDYEALLGEQPVRRRPDDTEKLIVTAGEDFTGLMQMSRLSIGLALLWCRQAHMDPFSHFFWLHRTDAFLKLAIASDRLRDLLVVACTGDPPKRYNNSTPKPLYVTPFRDAKTLLVARGLNEPRLSEPLASLPELGKQLWGYIARRNAIVHEVATRMGELSRDNISKLQKRFDCQQKQMDRPTIPRRGSRSVKPAPCELEGEVDRALNQLVDWYRLLIQASNAVFQIEYWSRTLAR